MKRDELFDLVLDELKATTQENKELEQSDVDELQDALNNIDLDDIITQNSDNPDEEDEQPESDSQR